MQKALATLSLTLLALAIAACSGGNDGNGADDGGASQAAAIFFAPENADALAHASLPAATDLPGSGWEVTARDDFGDDDEDDFDFEAFAAKEPDCSQLSTFANLGGIFGSEADEPPAGRAQVEFENAQSGGLLPNSLEVEVTIEETVSEVEGVWTLVKQLMESDQTQACMAAVFDEAFSEATTEGDIKAEVELSQASSPAPNGGTTMAFDIHMDISGIELDLAMEMYLWPYGNAAVNVAFMGTPDTVNSDLTGPALDAIVQKLEAAAGSEG